LLNKGVRMSIGLKNVKTNPRLSDEFDVPRRLLEAVTRTLIGKDDQVRLVITALIAGGHVLIEDIPGVGKTLLALAAARAMGVRFRRIQFTSDTLPSDVIGVNVYNPKSADFEFREGPIFTEVLLADEINRTSPRTQSALLEAMAEGKVSLDGVTRRLSEPFFVISTMNPVERFGSFDLPESQLDRFMLSFGLGYPDRTHEREILERDLDHEDAEKPAPVTDAREIIAAREAVRGVRVADDIMDYILDVAALTRNHPDIRLGLSSRAALHLKRAMQARALMEGRDFAIPEDLRTLFLPVARHRILLSGPSLDGGDSNRKTAVLTKILRSVDSPV
jgi:MoxR-like ATPase